MSSGRFSKCCVVVTGAGGGLGRALALGFASEGAHVVLTDVDGEQMYETANLVTAAAGTCSCHPLDLADEAAIQRFGVEVCGAHPQVAVLYNNAGLAYGEVALAFETLSLEKWWQCLAINTIAPLLLARALRPSLRNAGGVIINQSSMASYAPATAYGVTKAALNAMTHGMAHAFAVDGIRVNAIAPGLIQTPASTTGLAPETYARVQGMQLLPLHGVPDDIVRLALFLASSEARFINNEVVSCDAGNHLRGFRI